MGNYFFSSKTNSKRTKPTHVCSKISVLAISSILNWWLIQETLLNKTPNELKKLIIYYSLTHIILESNDINVRTIRYDILLKYLVIGNRGVGKV